MLRKESWRGFLCTPTSKTISLGTLNNSLPSCLTPYIPPSLPHSILPELIHSHKKLIHHLSPSLPPSHPYKMQPEAWLIKGLVTQLRELRGPHISVYITIWRSDMTVGWPVFRQKKSADFMLRNSVKIMYWWNSAEYWIPPYGVSYNLAEFRTFIPAVLKINLRNIPLYGIPMNTLQRRRRLNILALH